MYFIEKQLWKWYIHKYGQSVMAQRTVSVNVNGFLPFRSRFYRVKCIIQYTPLSKGLPGEISSLNFSPFLSNKTKSIRSIGTTNCRTKYDRNTWEFKGFSKNFWVPESHCHWIKVKSNAISKWNHINIYTRTHSRFWWNSAAWYFRVWDSILRFQIAWRMHSGMYAIEFNYIIIEFHLIYYERFHCWIKHSNNNCRAFVSCYFIIVATVTICSLTVLIAIAVLCHRLAISLAAYWASDFGRALSFFSFSIQQPLFGLINHNFCWYLMCVFVHVWSTWCRLFWFSFRLQSFSYWINVSWFIEQNLV